MIAQALIAGVIAGAVASFVMERFQYAWWDVIGWWKRRRHARAAASTAGSTSDASTVRVAAFFLCNVLGYELRPGEKAAAGAAVHYAFGIANGIVYALLVAYAPWASAGFGLAFGAALWLLADELMLWALRLARRPTEYPLSIHAYALAAHLVYGASLEAVRRIVIAIAT